jgi:hypothetical protein
MPKTKNRVCFEVDEARDQVIVRRSGERPRGSGRSCGHDREGGAALGVAEHLADPLEVALDSSNPSDIHEDHGTCSDHARIPRATSGSAFFVSDRNDRGFQNA